MSLPNFEPVLKTTAILLATLAAGTNVTSALITLPALLKAPSNILATQWLELYHQGTFPVVFKSVSSSLGFAILAYRAQSSGVDDNSAVLYGVASALALGFAPYTWLLMWGGIEELTRRAKGVQEKREGKSTHELVEVWGRQALFRGMLPLSAAALALWASIEK